MTPAGVYIHIPFCRSRCSYCDFATGLYQSELAERYVEAVVNEIESNTVAHSGLAVDTIYLGGGTPSLLSAGQLRMILGAVRAHFRVAEHAEVTMEMNPGTVSAEVLSAFREEGVNRASFGAQTFNDGELARLGRSHSVADTLKTFSDLRVAGFTNVSFDLIAGLPAQQMERWQKNVEEALKLRPEHLSFYLLRFRVPKDQRSKVKDQNPKTEGPGPPSSYKRCEHLVRHQRSCTSEPDNVSLKLNQTSINETAQITFVSFTKIDAK